MSDKLDEIEVDEGTKYLSFLIDFVYNSNILYTAVVVVVKWSACSPSYPTIWVQIPLKHTVFPLKFVLEKYENKQKESSVGPFFEKRYAERTFRR